VLSCFALCDYFDHVELLVIILILKWCNFYLNTCVILNKCLLFFYILSNVILEIANKKREKLLIIIIIINVIRDRNRDQNRDWIYHNFSNRLQNWSQWIKKLISNWSQNRLLQGVTNLVAIASVKASQNSSQTQSLNRLLNSVAISVVEFSC
jgi:hypothetical protein